MLLNDNNFSDKIKDSEFNKALTEFSKNFRSDKGKLPKPLDNAITETNNRHMPIINKFKIINYKC